MPHLAETRKASDRVLYLIAACRGALHGLMAEIKKGRSVSGHLSQQQQNLSASTIRSRIDRQSQSL